MLTPMPRLLLRGSQADSSNVKDRSFWVTGWPADGELALAFLSELQPLAPRLGCVDLWVSELLLLTQFSWGLEMVFGRK